VKLSHIDPVYPGREIGAVPNGENFALAIANLSGTEARAESHRLEYLFFICSHHCFRWRANDSNLTEM